MARGRWLKKMANRVKDRVEDVKEFVGTSKDDLVGTVSDTFSGMGSTANSVKERGSQCYQVARETVELCEATKSKSDQMVAFGSEIQSTLQSFGSSVDASALDTIKDLMDGDKLKEAMDIAKDMDVIALGCIDKSVQMIDIMEDAMDDLPDALENLIEKAANRQDTKEEDEALLSLKSLDKDIDDVKSCIDAVQHLNIATAFSIGLRAFEQLSGKAQQSRALFESIKGFSKNVEEICDDLKDLDVVSLASKIRDILRCIRLSEVMRAFAEGTKKIMQVMIDLFKAASDRICTLWAALAFAKECMADCVEHVLQAKILCLEARDKSRLLLENSESIVKQAKAVGTVNAESYGAVRNLSQGTEITDAIELARGMDDLIVECTSKVSSMVDRVSEGFQNLPDIITDGFDMNEEGKDDRDPQPVGVEEDIAELETSREAIVNADIFTACKSGVAGFSSVSKKTELCSDMLTNVEGFASNCNGTIESFMGVWDLESAMGKIKEMCRLVNMGELIKQFASQLEQLLLAIIALMKSAKDKFSSLDIKDLGLHSVTGLAENLSEAVGDKISGLVGSEIGDMVTGKFNRLWK